MDSSSPLPEQIEYPAIAKNVKYRDAYTGQERIIEALDTVCTSSGNEPLTLDASQKVHSRQEVASVILDHGGRHRIDQAAPFISI